MNTTKIKYKVFETSEDFEKFQEEHDVVVMQIQPYNAGFKMDISESTGSGEMNVAIFIVYRVNNHDRD